MQTFGCTEVGRRSNNEDAFVVDDGLGLYLVADGMGGHEGGEVASRLVVDTLQGFFRRVGEESPGFTGTPGEPCLAEQRMDLAIRMAHREVLKKATGSLREMGTTLAALLVRDGHALIAHVGDSRLYRQRHGRIERMTRDHSLVAELEASGCERLLSSLGRSCGHIVTRSISPCSPAEADIRVEQVRPGDRFLLATDGVTDALGDALIEGVLATEPTARGAAEGLLRAAYRAGGSDNLTAIVVDA